MKLFFGIHTSMSGMMTYWSFVIECHHMLYITAPLKKYLVIVKTEAETKACLHLCNYLSFIKKISYTCPVVFFKKSTCLFSNIYFCTHKIVLQNIQVEFFHKGYNKSKKVFS